MYVIDDLIQIREANTINPSGQYKGWADAWEVDRINGDTEKCPLCRRHTSGFKWLYPRKIRLTNTRYPDRLSSWISNELTVSERFVEAYNSTDLVGITKFNPIEIVSVASRRTVKRPPPKYFCADVIESKVRIDDDKSIIKGQKYDWSCEYCNPKGQTTDSIKLLVLDTANWGGEDIFRVFMSSLFFATQKFVDFCTNNNFTNFVFTPVDKYKI